jgi:hypothetical protein
MKHHDECLIADQPKSNIRCACEETKLHAGAIVTDVLGKRERDNRLCPSDLGRLYEHEIIDGDRVHLAAVVDQDGVLHTAVLSFKGVFQSLVRVHEFIPEVPVFLLAAVDPARLLVVAGLGAMRKVRFTATFPMKPSGNRVFELRVMVCGDVCDPSFGIKIANGTSTLKIE